MKAIHYREYGNPAEVLTLADVPDPPKPQGAEVLIEVLKRPIHPGDLLGVQGKYRAPGSSTGVAAGGSIPGFEGVGRVLALGGDVDPLDGISVGSRVAFFPARGAWSESVIAQASAVALVPEELSDNVAAQLHVTPMTAILLLRAVEAAGVNKSGDGTIVFSAGGSAVARQALRLALRRGLDVIGLVRTSAGAEKLRLRLPGLKVVSTDASSWRETVRDIAGTSPLRVVLDPVGGKLAAELVALMGHGGTLLSYGDLSGEPISVPSLTFSVRNITFRGISVGSWSNQPEWLRRSDFNTAAHLAANAPELFEVEAEYPLADIRQAVEHSQRSGKSGAVILTNN